MAISRYTTPVKVDTSLPTPEYNFDLLKETMGVLQGEVDLYETARSKFAPAIKEDKLGLEALQQEYQKNAEQVASAYTNDINAGRKSLYQTQRSIIADWGQGGRQNALMQRSAIQAERDKELAEKYDTDPTERGYASMLQRLGTEFMYDPEENTWNTNAAIGQITTPEHVDTQTVLDYIAKYAKDNVDDTALDIFQGKDGSVIPVEGGGNIHKQFVAGNAFESIYAFTQYEGVTQEKIIESLVGHIPQEMLESLQFKADAYNYEFLKSNPELAEIWRKDFKPETESGAEEFNKQLLEDKQAVAERLPYSPNQKEYYRYVEDEEGNKRLVLDQSTVVGKAIASNARAQEHWDPETKYQKLKNYDAIARTRARTRKLSEIQTNIFPSIGTQSVDESYIPDLTKSTVEVQESIKKLDAEIEGLREKAKTVSGEELERINISLDQAHATRQVHQLKLQEQNYRIEAIEQSAGVDLENQYNQALTLFSTAYMKHLKQNGDTRESWELAVEAKKAASEYYGDLSSFKDKLRSTTNKLGLIMSQEAVIPDYETLSSYREYPVGYTVPATTLNGVPGIERMQAEYRSKVEDVEEIDFGANLEVVNTNQGYYKNYTKWLSDNLKSGNLSIMSINGSGLSNDKAFRAAIGQTENEPSVQIYDLNGKEVVGITLTNEDGTELYTELGFVNFKGQAAAQLQQEKESLYLESAQGEMIRGNEPGWLTMMHHYDLSRAANLPIRYALGNRLVSHNSIGSQISSAFPEKLAPDQQVTKTIQGNYRQTKQGNIQLSYEVTKFPINNGTAYSVAIINDLTGKPIEGRVIDRNGSHIFGDKNALAAALQYHQDNLLTTE